MDRFNWARNKIAELTKPNAQIVDIGCGDCPITWDMPNCTWVDLDTYENIAEAIRKLGRTPIPRDRFIQGNIKSLPFQDKQFDLAICSDVLEHIGDPPAALKEVKRVARQAIITVPNEAAYDTRWKRPSRHTPYQFGDITYIRDYNKATLKQHLKEGGIDNYIFDRLDYDGWSFFTVVAKLDEKREQKKEANIHTLDSNFYDREYFEGSSKSGYGGRYAETEGRKQPSIANFLKFCFRGPMLDVGCAYGFLCAALQEAGVEARGIDISEYSIANALPQVRDKVSVCDVTLGTPFRDREFPTVVAFQTMEHIEINNIPLVVKEMCRISDEYVCIEAPTWYDDETPDRSDTFDKSHVSFYSASFWVDQFYAEGFFLDVKLSHKLKGTDSSRLVFYRGNNVPARLKDDFKVIRVVATEAEVKEILDDHYGVPKGYELPQPARVKIAEGKLKILVISSTVFTLPPKGYSGLEALVYEWSCEFAKQEHQVSVVAPEGSVLPEGIELIPTGLQEDEGQAYLRYKERLGEFDVIMDNSWLWYTVVAQMEAGDRQLPVIHIYHSDPDFLPPPPPIKFPCLVGLSKEHARKIKEKWGFSEVKFNYNGIPLDFYQFNPSIQRNGRYLWCARYTPEKMPLETIRLAKKCNIPLDLYGNTSIVRDQNYLNQCMAECDAKDVVFHLEVPREETVKLYQSHKALIHLVNYTEAFGLVPVEAMATGCPVIVNRRGALPELVEDGVSGFVVDTIEQAEEIIKSGKVDSIDNQACRQRAEMFSIERSARGYLELFREAISGRLW